MTKINARLSVLQNAELATKQLETLLIEQFEKKAQGTLQEDDFELESDRFSACFDIIKDLHTLGYHTLKQSKEATAEAKERMNEKQVGLQGVMYEKRHILEDIVQCRQFRSVYQDIELTPLEEFKAKADPEFLQNLDDPHQLMINRLKYELVVRKALKEQQEALQLKRAELIKENRKAQKKVDQFDKLLDDFVQSAVPLEEALEAEYKLNPPEIEMKEANSIEDNDPMETIA
ncbi:THO complex subunit 5 [Choanephora cucurbitarum]|uniref:THO complex subunit 5 n=1 Tax=Choanephora cucurbitarum TaxID=101091 RepID=A0A1C7NND6_9FUNG|nr:THO complex subunit 5 [Choanephora cucurbitarum]